MAEPLISVIMPVYNGGKFLDAAVQSILTQTHSEFEFIIIDDGSTDRSLQKLAGYAAKDQRIRLVSRPNAGVARTLNELFEQARGEFIARMDGDDVSLPLRFEMQMSYLHAHPEVVAVGTSFELIDDHDRLLTVRHMFPDNARIQSRLISGDSHLCHASVMMRRSAVQRLGGYDEAAYPAEDFDLWLRMGEIGELANLPDVLFRYREHPESISTKLQTTQIERKREACQRAWKRRGIEGRMEWDRPYRAGPDRESRFESAYRWAWMAYTEGRHRTAIAYSWRAIRIKPASRKSWGLLRRACLGAASGNGPSERSSP